MSTTWSTPSAPSVVTAGIELHGIQVFIVDPAVDHVDLPLPFGGADVVMTEQIATLDQFGTHLPSQQ